MDNVQAVEGINSTEKLVLILIVFLYKLLIYGIFSSLSLVYGLYITNEADHLLGIMLLIDSATGFFRMIVALFPFPTRNLKIIVIDKIIYNVYVLCWLITALIIGFMNLKKTNITDTYIYYWTIIAMTIIYRLIVTGIPLVVLCVACVNEKVRDHKIIKYLEHLDILSFNDGSLVDKEGKVIKKLNTDDNKCAICLLEYDPISKEEIVRLTCGHHFHKKCNEKWLHEKPSCPCCRAPVI